MVSRHIFLITTYTLMCLICLPLQGNAEPSELIGLITNKLGVTEKQAEGGAGSLFKIAKNNLSSENYTKLSQTIPGMAPLLESAPELPIMKGVGNLKASLAGGNAGGSLDMTSLPTMFSKLGMDQGMTSQFIPVILSYAQSKGGDSIMEMLKGVWLKS